MSPPQPKFIDLSTRAGSGSRARAEPPVGLAANVPPATLELYARTASALRLDALPRPVAIDEESARWLGFMTSLKARAAVGTVSEEQRATLVSIWDQVSGRQPALRRPAVGVSEDGVLQASWSFEDLPLRTLTLEILRDGSVEWFFRDGATGRSCGTLGEAERSLPAEAVELLVTMFVTDRGSG